MSIHNVMEEAVFAEIGKICATVEKEIALKNTHYAGICTCPQCRLDAACYVLNRIAPAYIISGRGVTHATLDTFERQQKMTDISIMVHEALLQVAHNRRPDFDHKAGAQAAKKHADGFFFNTPAIVGRVLNGVNFAPMVDIEVKLFLTGNLVKMKNGSWNNPCTLASKTEGTYAFWPETLPAPGPDKKTVLNYSIQAEMPCFEPLLHAFSLPLESDAADDDSFSMSRAFRLTDLYMFPAASAPRAVPGRA